MATTGTIISGVGHVGFLVWLIAGWGFDAEPLPFEVSEVSVVSGEEYAQIVAATTPQPGTADPSAPPVPEIADSAPVAETSSDEVPTPVQPDVVEPPVEDTPPPAPEQPAEPSEVTEAIPELPAAPDVPDAGAPDLAVSPRPQERQADRVAPTPVAPPPEDVAVAEVETASAAPDQDTPAEVVEERVEETAPEETASAIVPEDAVPSGAVETSVRPNVRPNRPSPAPTPAPVTPAETSTASSDNVESAVAAALADVAGAAPDIPQGPPMTGSEREGFRVAVNRCWNVDPGSVAARVTMVVGFNLDQNGKVLGDVRQISASGGDSSAQGTAFQAARRAILRCQNPNGYQLPADKYGQWQDVEITFDPSGMRLR
jgi:hypothetical protein